MKKRRRRETTFWLATDDGGRVKAMWWRGSAYYSLRAWRLWVRKNGWHVATCKANKP